MAKALGGYRPLSGHRYPRPDQPRLKRMRHVKLRPGQAPDEAALEELVESAYRDMGERLSAGACIK